MALGRTCAARDFGLQDRIGLDQLGANSLDSLVDRLGIQVATSGMVAQYLVEQRYEAHRAASHSSDASS